MRLSLLYLAESSTPYALAFGTEKMCSTSTPICFKHRLHKAAARHPDFHSWERVYAWLFVPFTLWPIDFHSLCNIVQERVKAEFNVAKFQDHKGIIRRRMVSERAFRSEWQLNWEKASARFQAVFDVFCHRWSLYGMQRDQPLLQKLTVNLTPHGTMVFIPSWWSLDPKRDLNWREIKKLHNARVASKQGAKLTRNQMEQTAEAAKAARFDGEAKARGLKGDRRAAPDLDARRRRQAGQPGPFPHSRAARNPDVFGVTPIFARQDTRAPRATPGRHGSASLSRPSASAQRRRTARFNS